MRLKVMTSSIQVTVVYRR